MSKPFKFKLDKVLDFREQLEEQAKAALSKARTLHDAQAEIVVGLENQMKAHLMSESESRKSANDMWLWRKFKEALEQDLSIARMELNSLELKLQRCLAEAVERSKDKKLLEKLKETQSKKYYDEENAREEKENDEMATLRYEFKDI